MYKKHYCGKNDQRFYTFEQKVSELFAPFSMINRKSFIGFYSNQTLPVLAEQLFARLHRYFCPLIFCNELQILQFGGSSCHHPGLSLPPQILSWIQDSG